MTRHLAIVAPPRPQGHMVPVAGWRRDCARYDTCLDVHLDAHQHRDVPASCPTPCLFEAPVVCHAVDYMGGNSALAAAIEEPIRHMQGAGGSSPRRKPVRR